MRSNGIEYGQECFPVRVAKMLASSGDLADIELSFEDIPTEINGARVSVESLLIVMPQSSVAPAASKLFDGASQSQFLKEVTINYAADSAPHKLLGHRQLCSKLDGNTLFNLLALRSGRACFPANGGNNDLSALPLIDYGGNDPNAINVVQSSQRISDNWTHFLGSFGGSDATSAAIVDRQSFVLPIGEVIDADDAPMPAEWLAGSGGCKGADAGSIVLRFGSTIDGQTITWTTAGDLGHVVIYALCRLSGEKQPAPNPLCITTHDMATTGVQSLPAGMVHFLGFVKRLTAGGAMGTHDYTDVEVTRDGDAQIMSKSEDHLRCMNATYGRKGSGFGYARTNAVCTGVTSAARYLNWSYPLLQPRQGTAQIRMPGIDKDNCLKVRINTTTETAHRLVYMRCVPFEAEGIRATIAAAQAGCQTAAAVSVQPNARNGNVVLTASLQKLLPQIIKRDPPVEMPK